MKKNFVSNGKESTRMFKNSFLESLSKVHFSVPLFIYVPVTMYFIYNALVVQQNNAVEFLLTAAGGLLFWTFTEYTLHRFVFHFEPKSTFGKRIHFIFHGVHHDYPNDAMRLVMPPSASMSLATGFYFLFYTVLPATYLPSFFAAFIGGYLFYDISHYALHHATFKNPLWKKLKQHHMLHHYSYPYKGYGVSSSLRDKIFGSDFGK